MNKPLKPKDVKPQLSKPATAEKNKIIDLPAVRVIINSDSFRHLIENVLVQTLGRYSYRDNLSHVQSANLSAREGVQQFINDLYDAVNVTPEEEQNEQYD